MSTAMTHYSTATMSMFRSRGRSMILKPVLYPIRSEGGGRGDEETTRAQHGGMHVMHDSVDSRTLLSEEFEGELKKGVMNQSYSRVLAQVNRN